MKAALDTFVKTRGQGTMFGNSIVNRYVKDPKFVKNAVGDDERKRFGATVDLFCKYSDRYEVDYLLIMAQGFQEPGLDQQAKSPVGAIGMMHVMPATGKDLKGRRYQGTRSQHPRRRQIRTIHDRPVLQERADDAARKRTVRIRSYNAGPGRVAQLRREATKRGFDPNRWFNNVELVAANKIGPETVTYVSNIYKYSTAYKLLTVQGEERRKARESVKRPN